MMTTAGDDQGDDRVDGGTEGASTMLGPPTRLGLRGRRKHDNQIVHGSGGMGGGGRWWSGGSGATRGGVEEVLTIELT